MLQQGAAVAVAASVGACLVSAAATQVVTCYFVVVSIVFVSVLWRRGGNGKLTAVPGKICITPAQDGPAFSFGVAGAPGVFVDNDNLSFYEEQVGTVYAVWGPEAKPVKLRSHLDQLHRILRLPRQESGLQEPLDDLMLGRLLIATDFNVEKTVALAKRYEQWRRDLRGGNVPCARALTQGFVRVPFEDRLGRPVVVVQARLFDPRQPLSALESTYRATVDAVITHLLYRRTGRLNATNMLEQYVLVIDMEGAGWGNFSTSGVKLMVQESNYNYPDRLAQIYVLRCNATSIGIWRIVKPMIHPRTRRKVELVAPEAVQETMRRLVDPASLPPHYGGSAPAWPPASESCTLEEKAGVLAAEAWRRAGVVPRVEATGRAFVSSRGSRGSFLEKYDVKIEGATTSAEGGTVARSIPECAELVNRVEAITGVPPARRSSSRFDGWSRGCVDWSQVFACFAVPSTAHLREEALSAEAFEVWLNQMLDSGGEAKLHILNFVSSSAARLPPSPRPG